MSVDISATYLARNTFFILLVNNSFRVHGECTKQTRKPRQTKKVYSPQTKTEKLKKPERHNGRFFSFGRNRRWKVRKSKRKSSVKKGLIQGITPKLTYKLLS